MNDEHTAQRSDEEHATMANTPLTDAEVEDARSFAHDERTIRMATEVTRLRSVLKISYP